MFGTGTGFSLLSAATDYIFILHYQSTNVNALGNLSGINPSTIYSMLNTKSQNPGVVSLQKICDGLEISIRDFFNDELFDNIEQEII